MKKIFINFVTVIFVTTLFVSKALAMDLNFGVSGAIVNIQAEGTETETGAVSAEKINGSASNTVGIGSVFAELQFDRLAFGIDYIPFDADVSDKVLKRTDTETSVTGTLTTTSTKREQEAQAEISDHMTIYANYYVTDTLYVHLGHTSVDVATQESLGTGSKYADISLDGIQYGIGLQMTDRFRLEFAHTDYDSFDITSSVARTGVSTNNKISGDLDTTQLKLSLVF